VFFLHPFLVLIFLWKKDQAKSFNIQQKPMLVANGPEKLP